MGAIGPLIPPAKRGGNKRTVDVREVVNGVMYILSTGCQWAALPKDLPPRSTVNDYFRRWDADGTLDRIHHALYVQCREQAGREASPTAAIIDSQSVKSAEKGGAAIDPAGYDAGKKIKGKKRHVLVDTQGLLMQAIVHAADIQDRDGGVLLMGTLFGLYPFLLKLYADSGYQGPKFQAGLRAVCRQVNVEIVKRSDAAQVRRPAQALDRRADHRLAQPLPPVGQGLGVPEPQRARLPALGLRPPHAPKAMPKHNMISDGLNGCHHRTSCPIHRKRAEGFGEEVPLLPDLPQVGPALA